MATELSALGVKITSTGVVKTTNELDKFTVAATAAGKAAKPINVKVNANVAKALADMKALDRALSGIRDASRAGISISSAGGAKAVSDLNKMAVAAKALQAIGSISIPVDVPGASAAISELNKLSSAANNAKAAMGGLASSATTASAATASVSGNVGRASAGFRRAKKDIDDTGKAFKFTASESLNFSRQIADVGVTAAMGMNPLMIAVQQGPQLFDILQTAGQRSGKGIGGAFRAAAASMGSFSAALALTGVAIGTAAIAWNVWLGQVNDEKKSGLEAYAKSIGLTAKEIEKAGGAAVTSADMIGGLWDATKRALELDALFKDVETWITEAFNNAVANAKQNLSELYAAIYVIDDILAYVGKHGGEVLAEGLINGINASIRAINQFGTLMGPDGKAVWSPDIQEIKNDYTGAGDAASKAFNDAITTGYEKRKKQAGAAIGGFFDDAVNSAANRARKRLDAERSDTKDKPDRRAEALARELEATEALISGLYKSTAAYAESEAAGQRAAIVADATAAAIKKQADATSYVALQIRKVVAEQVNGAVKAIAASKVQNDAQEAVNKMVASGALAHDDAADALARLNAQRELLNTIELAELAKDAQGAAVARAALAALNDEQERAIRLRKQREDQAASTETKRNIDAIQKETELQRQLGEGRRNALRGLSGDALENELARLADQYEINAIMLEYETKIARENAAAHYENAAALAAERDARIAQAKVGQGQANDERTFDQDRRRALDLADAIGDVIAGKVGGVVRSLADVLQNNFPQVLQEMGGLLKGFDSVIKNFSKGAAIGGVAGGAVGSATGGSIGGGLGTAAFEQFAGAGLKKALGKFGGPLAGIAGGLIGGLIGGLLKKTPKASATVSIIAGEAMETAITGNKGALKKIAGGMADSVIAGLAGIADTLGADLAGNAKVSIGIRKKNYRVDETGMGRTKGAGVQDFGDDQAAAIAYAIQVAIKQGVLDGLSESMKRLIMADGDFQAQLQKALSFKSVFDELAQKDDPAKWAQDAITKWHDGMAKIFKEAGATADELAELERLTGIKRLEAAKEATEEARKAAEQLATDRRQLELRIIELQGDALGALALSRQIELDAMDASLRPMQEMIHLLEDRAAAEERARAIEDERLGLVKELWAERGREDGLRLLHLNTLAESNKAIQLEIWALQDQKKAAEELAAVQQKNAEEARGLQERIDQMMGNTAAIRERELSAVDASNRALVERIHMLEDEAKAAEAARAIADQADGLQSRWLQLIGDTTALRERELAALDPSNRALLQRIFAEEDRQAAAEAATKAQEEYISSLNEAAGNLGQVAERMRGFAREIREFKSTLFADPNQGGNGYGRVAEQFRSTSRMAAMGNENSLASFVGDAQAFLEAARDNARSSLDYRRAVSEVAGASDRAIGGAEGLASNAEQQVAALNATVAQLQSVAALGASQVSLADLANQIQTGQVVPAIEDTVGGGLEALRAEVIMLRRELQERRDEEKAEALAIARNTSATAANLDRVTRNGDTLAVLVDNPVTSPVPTLEVTP